MPDKPEQNKVTDLSMFTPEQIEAALRHTLSHREACQRWYTKNREKRLDYGYNYNFDHKEEIATRNASRRERNHDEILAYAAKYYKENRERMYAWNRAWKQRNPERTKWLRVDGARRYRARIRGAKGSFTSEEFEELCKAFDSKCAYCGTNEEQLVPDHMQPLSKGGSNSIENIIPACMTCNQRKLALTYDEFVNKLREEAKEL